MFSLSEPKRNGVMAFVELLFPPLASVFSGLRRDPFTPRTGGHR
jgi:hypothetical protein